MSPRAASTTRLPENRAPSRLAVGGRARDPRELVPAALRDVAKALSALATLLESGPAPAPDLVDLGELPCSRRQARAMIARGELPAVRRGRSYLVLRQDVERVFSPTVRAPRPRRTRESETARERRQLAAAGIELRSEAP